MRWLLVTTGRVHGAAGLLTCRLGCR
jgi:hypothetical protein